MRAALLLALAAGGLLLLHRQAQARTLNSQAEDPITDVQDAQVGAWQRFTSDPWAGFSAQDVDVWGAIQSGSDAAAVGAAVQRGSGNVGAFLRMIAVSEGTEREADPYRVCYGYRHVISSFADHPAVTGEWRGESLASLGPSYVGKVSTAAGRYQIIRPTWLEAQRALGLRDFSPASQDAAALYLIRRRGALDAVEAGRVADAIALCRPEWASLPGAGYGQPERRMADLVAAYQAAGGTVA